MYSHTLEKQWVLNLLMDTLTHAQLWNQTSDLWVTGVIAGPLKLQLL